MSRCRVAQVEHELVLPGVGGERCCIDPVISDTNLKLVSVNHVLRSIFSSNTVQICLHPGETL